MSNPFDQFDSTPSAASNPFDQFDSTAPVTAAQPQASSGFLPRNADGSVKWLPSSFGEFMKDQANNLVRGGIKAVTGLPLMAEDAGVAVRDLIAGKNAQGRYPYDLPSTAVNQALDSYTQAPTSGLGKVGEFTSSVLLGSRIPAPTYTPSSASASGLNLLPHLDQLQPVPSNFMPSSTPAQQTLSQARAAGYAIPPSTTNPTLGNKILESIGGKAATAQDASIANTEVTNNLARRALGMGEDEAITPGALGQIRTAAGKAYQAVIDKAGSLKVQADDAYTNGIKAVTDKFQGVAEDFGPSLTNSKVLNAAEDLNKPQFSADSAIKATQILRDNASAAFAQGDKQTGQAYRALSDNVESLLERHLAASGDGEALAKFQDARQLIAKTYSVEKALNPATSNVSAVALGKQLAKGKPLSGDLFTAAAAGMAFPKATREILDSGSVRNTDIITGGLAAVMQHQPAYLVYPFLRQGVRAGLLSDAGQSLAQPGSAGGITSGLPGSIIAQWDLLK